MWNGAPRPRRSSKTLQPVQALRRSAMLQPIPIPPNVAISNHCCSLLLSLRGHSLDCSSGFDPGRRTLPVEAAMFSSANGATRAPSHPGAGTASSSRKATMSVSHSPKPRFRALLRPGTGSTMYWAENSAAVLSACLSPSELSMTRILSGAGTRRATAARHFARRPGRFLVHMTTVTVREFSLDRGLDGLCAALGACDVTCEISYLDQKRL